MNRVLWPTELRRRLPNSFVIIHKNYRLVNWFLQKYSGTGDKRYRNIEGYGGCVAVQERFSMADDAIYNHADAQTGDDGVFQEKRVAIFKERE